MRHILSRAGGTHWDKRVRAAFAATVVTVLTLSGFGLSGASAAVVVGTNHPDTIVAPQTGPDADQVTAKAGADFIKTYAGNDTVSAGLGNDTTRLGAGNDGYTENGEGADKAIGNGGDDNLATGFGPDVANGGGGADYIKPGAGRDFVNAGEAADYIVMGDDGNRDEVFCGDGSDTVHYTSAAPDAKDVLNDCELVTPPAVSARGTHWD